MAVSKRNLPATIEFCTTIDVIRLVIDRFFESIFIGRIRFFIVGLALIRIVVLIGTATRSEEGNTLFP